MAGEIGLTDAKIAGLKPATSGQIEYPDKIVAGLRVRIGSTGVKTFILRKRVGGKLRNITLGRYGANFGLSAARRKARDILVDIEAGRDPTENLATPRKTAAGTVTAMVERYLAEQVRGKKRSAREIERILRNYVQPAIGERLADSVTRGDVTRLIDQVGNSGSGKFKSAMARAVFAQLSAFYSWATPRLDRLPANPCRDAGRPAPVPARDRVLTPVEIGAFWRACACMERPFGPGFKLLLLTGQRRAEVFEAELAEFHDDHWIIPAARAKNGVANIVPLSYSARAVIGALAEIEGSSRLFPSRADPNRGASGFSRALQRVQKRMAVELQVVTVEPFVLHDLRRSVATNMQRLGIAMPVVEAVLNHVSGSRAGGAGIYQRHNYLQEKTVALDAWDREVQRLAQPR